ncbi:MAG: pirin family protein [Candidatus Eremiobacteraeota bacterium]|nr:pirin family protein [Candidatus Eremiobacteraeota bacterium]
MTARKISLVLPAHQFVEGGGFTVHRPFPVQGVMQVDPFLLIDELGPVQYAPGEAVGAPDHPHRGFETVTYMIDGEFQHADSAGHRGELHPGDVQWMTAGAGVVHAEMPSDRMMREGGQQHGFQIWINLPKAEKMVRPRYQDVRADTIPTWTSADGRAWAKVIAGEAQGVRGAAETRIPIGYVHYRLQPGARIEHAVRDGDTAIVYLMRGSARFSADRTHDARVAIVFDPHGDLVPVTNVGLGELEFLVLTGKPIGEPVARYGPFVMNSTQELEEAFRDFQSGKMGDIEPIYN